MRDGTLILLFVTVVALLSGCGSSTTELSASPGYGMLAPTKARTCVQNGGVWRDNIGVCTGIGR